MKTYSAKISEIKKDWWIIDAKDLILGRLSAIIATYLRGKHKANYTPNLDCGDNIVVINADKIHLTGKKLQNKKYYWHTGYPGGIKSRTAKQLIEGDFPTRVLENSVKRMISRNPLGRKQLKKLHIYSGETHPHEAQQPQILDVAKLNSKNTK